jgi:hypothetical protein
MESWGVNKMAAKATRHAMEVFVKASPDYLYAEAIIGDTTVRYVFKDKVCLGLTEAFLYAQSLQK